MESTWGTVLLTSIIFGKILGVLELWSTFNNNVKPGPFFDEKQQVWRRQLATDGARFHISTNEMH